MSYILDALKKSEQERQSNEGPTIQTIQRPLKTGSHRAGTGMLMLVVLGMVGVVAIASYLWIYRPQPAVLVGAESPPVSAESAEAATDSPSLPAPVAAEEDYATVSPAQREAGGSSPTVAFSDLPDSVRHQIPALTFSFHVYSDVASSRTIIINKRRVKEGDEVLQYLRLKEITAEGVVLDWKGRSFYINVVENW